MALRAVTDHPKFARLKMTLKLGKGSTLGYLEAMWHFCGRYTPQGNIGKYQDEEIEAWVEWDGEPGALMAAFVKAGWLDKDKAHRLLVHDWHEWADPQVHSDLAKKTLTFIGGQWPRLPETMSGETRKRIRAEFVAKYGPLEPKSPDRCPDKVQTESGQGPDQPVPEPEPEPEPVPEPRIPPAKARKNSKPRNPPSAPLPRGRQAGSVATALLESGPAPPGEGLVYPKGGDPSLDEPGKRELIQAQLQAMRRQKSGGEG